LVERGPEKAGVGGSIPSLATNNFNNLQIAKSRVKTSSRVQYAYIGCFDFTFGAARSNDLHTSRAVLLLGISSSKRKIARRINTGALMRTATKQNFVPGCRLFFPADFTKRILITDLGPFEKVRGFFRGGARNCADLSGFE
jgi:hypothetical protein